jgi:hypothetical protein
MSKPIKYNPDSREQQREALDRLLKDGPVMPHPEGRKEDFIMLVNVCIKNWNW